MQLENLKIVQRQLQKTIQQKDPEYRLFVTPDNMSEVHFSVRGPTATEYQGGWYHGVIKLPRDYPYRPPDVIMLSKSGRFEIGTKLCFSFTSYHPETWSPAVGIGPIIIALQSLFTAYDERAVGMISAVNKQDIEKYRKAGKEYYCDVCNCKHNQVEEQMEDVKKQ